MGSEEAEEAEVEEDVDEDADDEGGGADHPLLSESAPHPLSPLFLSSLSLSSSLISLFLSLSHPLLSESPFSFSARSLSTRIQDGGLINILRPDTQDPG